MKIFKIFLFLFLPLNIFAYTNESFFWICHSKINCNLLALTAAGKKISILHHWKQTEIGTVAFKYYQNHLGKVSYSCGSPCSYTTFVNFKNGNISDSYFLVSAVDSKNFLIALPDPTDKNDNTLEIIPIFHPQSAMKIKKYFSRGVSISLAKAQFVNDYLLIKYQSGNNFEDHQDEIPVNYQQLKF